MVLLAQVAADSKLQPVFLVHKQIAVLRKVMEINLHTATPWYSSTKSSSDAAPCGPGGGEWTSVFKLCGNENPMFTYSQQHGGPGSEVEATQACCCCYFLGLDDR